jgi:hypothetical protein
MSPSGTSRLVGALFLNVGDWTLKGSQSAALAYPLYRLREDVLTAPMACIRIVMTTTAAIKNALDNGSPIQILHRDRDIGPIDTHAVH